MDLICLLFIICVSSNSFHIYEEYNLKLILFLLLGVFYYYSRIIFTGEKDIGTYLSIFLLLTGCLEAVWGLGQLYGLLPSFHSSFKITGSFYNPGPYSGYLAIIFPMAVYYLLKDTSCIFRKRRSGNFICQSRWLISLLAFSLIIIILPAGMSRAAWLAATGGSLCAFLCYAKKMNIHWWQFLKTSILKTRVKKTFALLGVIAACHFIAWGIYQLKTESADGRLLIWKNTIQMIINNPSGVGLGYFPGQYGNSQIEYFASGKASAREIFLAGRPDYAFNEYIQIAAESGITGLILFLVIVLIGIQNAFRQEKYNVIVSMVSILIFASLSYPFNLLPILIVFVFLLSQCGDGNIIIRENKWNAPAIGIVCIIFAAYILYNQRSTYQAHKDWFVAQQLYNTHAYENANKLYKHLKPHFFDKPTFLFEYANCLSQCQKYEESNRILTEAYRYCCDPILFIRMGINYQKIKDYNKAISYFQKAGYLIPNRQYPYYLLALLYKKMGNHEKAIELAKHCLKKQPKVNSQAAKEIRKEMIEILISSNDLLDKE